MQLERYFLSFAVTVSSLVSASSAQTCIDQVRQHAHSQPSAMVSASSLREPPKAKQHYEKARRAAEANHVDEFEREAAATLAIAPDYAEVYLLRGVLQVYSGHDAQALDSIATARSLQPELPMASIVVASALTHMARYAEAATELSRFHYLNQTWQWEFEMTRASLGEHNVEGALHWSQLTEEDAPESCPDTHLLRINALEMAGRKNEAILAMESYLASGKALPQRDAVTRLLERERKAIEASAAPPLVASR